MCERVCRPTAAIIYRRTLLRENDFFFFFFPIQRSHCFFSVSTYRRTSRVLHVPFARPFVRARIAFSPKYGVVRCARNKNIRYANHSVCRIVSVVVPRSSLSHCCGGSVFRHPLFGSGGGRTIRRSCKVFEYVGCSNTLVLRT